MMRKKLDIQTEVLLAVMPTVMVVAVLVLLETFSRQQLLFSSLASSAFLIYLDPRHPVNSIRTLVVAQITAGVIGFLVYQVMGPGYFSAGISMVLSITLMIVLRTLHPPAVSSAMIFAFQPTKPDTVLLFFTAVVMLVLLIVLQRASLWLLKKGEQKLRTRLSPGVPAKQKHIDTETKKAGPGHPRNSEGRESKR